MYLKGSSLPKVENQSSKLFVDVLYIFDFDVSAIYYLALRVHVVMKLDDSF